MTRKPGKDSCGQCTETRGLIYFGSEFLCRACLVKVWEEGRTRDARIRRGKCELCKGQSENLRLGLTGEQHKDKERTEAHTRRLCESCAKQSFVLRIVEPISEAEYADILRQQRILPAPKEYPPVSLEVLKATIKKWLLITDEEALDIILAFAIGEQLPGDPLWLFLIAPPGGGKTELLRALEGIQYYHLSDLTSKTFVSGLMLGQGEDRRKIDDLLPQLNRKVLIFKDFTTVLEKNRDERQEIFAQLREIYDGQFSKKFGTLDAKVEYKTRFGLIAGVTPVIDMHWKLMQQLGERFLKYRWGEDADKTTRRAEANEGREKAMREEIHQAMMGYLTNIKVLDPDFPGEMTEPLIKAAKFLAELRTPVAIHAGQSDFYYDFIPTPECPTRLVKQLKKLSKALAVIRGHRAVASGDVCTAIKVALSTSPPDRLAVLTALETLCKSALQGVTVAQIKRVVQLPETSIRNILQQLVMLRLVEEEQFTRERDGYREMGTYYALSKKVSALSPPAFLEASNNVGGDIAQGLRLFFAKADPAKAYSVEAIGTLCDLEPNACEELLRKHAIPGESFEKKPGFWCVLR